MPLHVCVLDNDSKFYAGLAQGNCEYYDTDKGKALKGFMSNSILVGPNNLLILFTSTSFQYFIGQYINNNKPNGNMIVYTFAGNDTPLNEILNPIDVQKSNCVYSNGVLVESSSSETIQVNLLISYKFLKDITFMIGFSLVEVVV